MFIFHFRKNFLIDKMTILFLAIFSLYLSFLIISCHNKKNDSPDKDEYSWTVMPKEFDDVLNDMWGPDDLNIFVVGDNGLVMKFDGQNWITFDLFTSYNLIKVFGLSKTNVFSFALENGQNGNGDYYHYDGTAWEINSNYSPIGFHPYDMPRILIEDNNILTLNSGEIEGYYYYSIFFMEISRLFPESESVRLYNEEEYCYDLAAAEVDDTFLKKVFVLCLGEIIYISNGEVIHYDIPPELGLGHSGIQDKCNLFEYHPGQLFIYGDSLKGIGKLYNNEIEVINFSDHLGPHKVNKMAALDGSIVAIGKDDGAVLWKMNGNQMDVELTNENRQEFYDIWNDENENVAVISAKGAFLHYNGEQWIEKKVPDAENVSFIKMIVFSKNNIFALGRKPDGTGVIAQYGKFD